MITAETRINEIDIPGSNQERTLLFLLYIALYTWALWEGEGVCILFKWFSRSSMGAALLVTLVLIWTNRMANSTVAGCKSIVNLLMPKIIITLLALGFFVEICILIVVFGGIKSSPFAGVLTISPLLIVVEFMNQTHYRNYVRIAAVIYGKKSKKERAMREVVAHVANGVSVCVWLTGAIVLATITVMEMLLYGEWIAPKVINLEKVQQMGWYQYTYLGTYLAGFMAAAAVVLPRGVVARGIAWAENRVSGRGAGAEG